MGVQYNYTVILAKVLMTAIQKHLPLIVVILLAILLALGVYGFVKTQQSVPPRDFVIMTDEPGGGYDEIAQQYRRLLKLRDRRSDHSTNFRRGRSASAARRG